MIISIFDKPNRTRTRLAISYLGHTRFLAWSARENFFGDRLSERVREYIQCAFNAAFHTYYDWNSPRPFIYEVHQV